MVLAVVEGALDHWGRDGLGLAPGQVAHLLDVMRRLRDHPHLLDEV